MKNIFLLLLSCWVCSLKAEVYDCFTFFNELELLKVRLEELYDSVDHFVLVEATETFSGEVKPLYFQENQKQFAAYMDKIIHVVVEDLPPIGQNPHGDKWNREEFQRNAILRGLIGCAEDDIIMISDLDEIPNKKAVGEIKSYFSSMNPSLVSSESELICALNMRLFLFRLNCESPQGWMGAVKAAPYWLVQKKSPWSLKILHMYDPHLVKIANAGWHFHNMFGNQKTKLIAKLRACFLYPQKDFAHANHPGLAKLGEKEEWVNHEDDYISWTLSVCGWKIVPIDGTFPRYIQQNLAEFRQLGWMQEEM
jgi:beta-1,4-mannosyl-glycoprotein beta-1,4-N-acetylglucosaminyltransferase